MRNVVLYIAISLNGKIAKKSGDVGWLNAMPVPEDSDYGYKDFYDSVETTIQGNSTYQQVLNWNVPFPYKGKENYVITTNVDAVDTEDVKFITSNYVEAIKKLKAQEGGYIWLIGGSKVNSLFMENNLIDEMRVFVMPIVLESGIDVFADMKKDNILHLQSALSYSTGTVELRYKVLHNK